MSGWETQTLKGLVRKRNLVEQIVDSVNLGQDGIQ